MMAENRETVLTLTSQAVLTRVRLLGSPTYLTFSLNLYVSLGFNLFRVYNLNSRDVFCPKQDRDNLLFQEYTSMTFVLQLRVLTALEISSQSEDGRKVLWRPTDPATLLTSLIQLQDRKALQVGTRCLWGMLRQCQLRADK